MWTEVQWIQIICSRGDPDVDICTQGIACLSPPKNNILTYRREMLIKLIWIQYKYNLATNFDRITKLQSKNIFKKPRWKWPLIGHEGLRLSAGRRQVSRSLSRARHLVRRSYDGPASPDLSGTDVECSIPSCAAGDNIGLPASHTLCERRTFRSEFRSRPWNSFWLLCKVELAFGRKRNSFASNIIASANSSLSLLKNVERCFDNWA